MNSQVATLLAPDPHDKEEIDNGYEDVPPLATRHPDDEDDSTVPAAAPATVRNPDDDDDDDDNSTYSSDEDNNCVSRESLDSEHHSFPVLLLRSDVRCVDDSSASAKTASTAVCSISNPSRFHQDNPKGE